MSLTFEERVAAVERLTEAANASPGKYRLRVIAWISLGYAIVTALMLLSLALSVGVVAFIVYVHVYALLKFVIIPAAYGLMIGRALFIRIPPPEGRELRRHEAPKLFAILDEIRARTRVPKVDRVLIVSDMNAGVVETPRFGGLLGWRRQLLIGLPLLLALSPDEMKAVLAHELGHLSGQHGRVSAWSWRVRMTWAIVLASVDARGGATARTLQRIMHWYVERLMLITLVLARKHELAADATAAEVTSRETAARTLAWVAVSTKLLDDRFWSPLWERTATEPEPPPHPLHDLMRTREQVFAPPFDELLATELERNTALDDTHPSLRARLEHLGVPETALGVSARSAADELLGRTAAAVIVETDRQWRAAVAPLWAMRHGTLAVARKQIEETPATVDDADVETLHRRAEALVDLGRDDEALPIFETILARDAQDTRAAFHIGRIRVQRGELEGLQHLSAAMERDWRFAAASCEIAYTALRAKGREQEADRWAEQHQQHLARMAVAEREARSLSNADAIGATNLSPEAQEAIIEACRKAKWVSTVWIARKELDTLRFSVDFVAVRAKSFRFVGQKRLQALAEQLPVVVFLVTNRALMQRLDAAGGRRFLR